MKWRVIPGFERYEITRDGRIRHRVTKRERTHSVCGTTPSPRTSLYIGSKDGKRIEKSFTIARLVSMTFEGPIAPGHVVVRCGSTLRVDQLCRFDAGAHRSLIHAARAKTQLAYGKSTAARIRKMKADGASFRSIAKQTGVPLSVCHRIVHGIGGYAP